AYARRLCVAMVATAAGGALHTRWPARPRADGRGHAPERDLPPPSGATKALGGTPTPCAQEAAILLGPTIARRRARRRGVRGRRRATPRQSRPSPCPTVGGKRERCPLGARRRRGAHLLRARPRARKAVRSGLGPSHARGGAHDDQTGACS